VTLILNTGEHVTDVWTTFSPVDDQARLDYAPQAA
jgi:hypothetical protein